MTTAGRGDRLAHMVAALQDLSGSEAKVAMVLLHHGGENGLCTVGETRIAEATGMSVATVKRARRKLAELGLLLKIAPSSGRSPARRIVCPKAKRRELADPSGVTGDTTNDTYGVSHDPTTDASGVTGDTIDETRGVSGDPTNTLGGSNGDARGVTGDTRTVLTEYTPKGTGTTTSGAPADDCRQSPGPEGGSSAPPEPDPDPDPGKARPEPEVLHRNSPGPASPPPPVDPNEPLDATVDEAVNALAAWGLGIASQDKTRWRVAGRVRTFLRDGGSLHLLRMLHDYAGTCDDIRSPLGTLFEWIGSTPTWRDVMLDVDAKERKVVRSDDEVPRNYAESMLAGGFELPARRVKLAALPSDTLYGEGGAS